MRTVLLALDPIAVYLIIGLAAIWRLPTWGRKVLGFLRDLRRFRGGN